MLADQEQQSRIAEAVSASQLMQHLVDSGINQKQAESILAQLADRSAGNPKLASDDLPDTVPASIKTEIVDVSVSSRLSQLEQERSACDLANAWPIISVD